MFPRRGSGLPSPVIPETRLARDICGGSGATYVPGTFRPPPLADRAHATNATLCYTFWASVAFPWHLLSESSVQTDHLMQHCRIIRCLTSCAADFCNFGVLKNVASVAFRRGAANTQVAVINIDTIIHASRKPCNVDVSAAQSV